MPFRHSNEESNLKFVMEQMQSRQTVEIDNERLLDRFVKTTVRKMYDAEDTKKVDETTEILEHYPFDADESDIMRHKLVRCMNDFLRERWNPSQKCAVVSLSGGVDSMCILKCLTLLQPIYKYTVVAIHIDYGNRQESGLEADFVENWCKKNKVEFRKRIITEVTRGITDRDLYEKESRRIRFEFYQQVLNEFGTDTGISLGHHKGDEQENIITNIMKGRESILNLSGMAPEGIISGVRVWRPFLTYTKDVIFKFAHKYGIPYFLDTTPKWSNRGKLRNELQPMLKDIFGAGYLKNLTALGQDSNELQELTYTSIFRPFWDSIQRSNVGVWLNIDQHREKPKLFWKETMRYLFHSMGTSTVRDKSMIHFMKRAPTREEEVVWISLKKENPSLLYKEYLVVFRQTYFPDTPYFINNTKISPDGTKYSFGKWNVTCKKVPRSEYKFVELSIWDILSGKFTYYLKNSPSTSSSSSSSLEIDSNSRIKPFREIPRNITQVIPIVHSEVDKSPDSVDDEHSILVQLEFISNELEEEMERLKQREDEKQTIKKTMKPKLHHLLNSGGADDDNDVDDDNNVGDDKPKKKKKERRPNNNNDNKKKKVVNNNDDDDDNELLTSLLS
eukprot:TRINITY_DN442_c0_g5_i3.p1 TRINITY_DN442_c0_g5~~TRINITY_DN442_c0_g5_i3.p1  ORF type:complete len:617 (-),score=190.29 TRINITY_DN442_c0_g5_i3:126-1976(-)